MLPLCMLTVKRVVFFMFLFFVATGLHFSLIFSRIYGTRFVMTVIIMCSDERLMAH